MSKSLARGLALACLLYLVAPAQTAGQEAGTDSDAVKRWDPAAGKPGLWGETMTTPFGASTSSVCLNLTSGTAVLGGEAHQDSCDFTHVVGPDGSITTNATCRPAGQGSAVVLREALSSDHKRILLSVHNLVGGNAVDWTQTFSFLGECPVSMRPDQKVLMLMRGPDGKLEEWRPTLALH